MKGFEIDRYLSGTDVAFSAGVHNGKIGVDIGEDWAGRYHGPDRPQGYLRQLDFTFSLEEAKEFREWLNLAISFLEMKQP